MLFGEEVVGGGEDGVGKDQCVAQEMLRVRVCLKGDDNRTRKNNEQTKKFASMFPFFEKEYTADDSKDWVNDAD